MAHHVEQMAYVGQTPWHGLGNQLSANQPIEVWQQQAGMGWDIKESPVQFMDSIYEAKAASSPSLRTRSCTDPALRHRYQSSASAIKPCNRVKFWSFIAT